MKSSTSQQVKPAVRRKSSLPRWVSPTAWGIALVMVLLMLFLLYQRSPVAQQMRAKAQVESQPAVEAPTSLPAESVVKAPLPELDSNRGVNSLVRLANPRTIIPTRPRSSVVNYTIKKGDSIFGIASEFKIKPESILWANYEVLNDDPHQISIGQEIKIPPVDGILYQWKEGDKLEDVAARFHADPKEILSFPGNKLDMTDPKIEPGQYIMIPGGWRELKPWVVPVAYAPKSGVTKGISGPGGCEVPSGGAVGSGAFIWPAVQHFLSGNDYWSGHLAIDIAAGEGAPVYAADSGVVVYAGAIGGGYGNMIMIDHQNGYHTLYAHLSSINVRCGQSVAQGSLIGLAGSTGNSTGAHLHFEVRYLGGFINPWYVLP